MTSDFVARQPIFTQRERVYGYELLFRAGLDESFNSHDGDKASCQVADHLLTLGQTLTQGRNAFINCTREFLVRDYAMLLPRGNTVVEVLETVAPDREVLDACRRLKQAGYLIALDDFVYTDHSQPLIDLADIIKVDFLGTSPPFRKWLIQRFAPRGIRMLAEKVETREDFDQAVKLGYHYFQGYFFCKPQMVIGKRIPAFKPHYLRIVQEVMKPEMNFAEIENLMRREISLTHKLLTYMNSALFGFRNEIRSIHHALTLLGEKEVKRMVLLVAALGLGEDKPPELIVTSLARARCCELLASVAGLVGQSSTLFLTGLFSLVDALLGRPMEEILEQMAMPSDVKAALLGRENALREIYEIVLAYERAQWKELSQKLEKASLNESVIPDIYLESLDWARKVFDISPSS
jgi:EAL and modified HD-GYP domain-containing signal transduction protein